MDAVDRSRMPSLLADHLEAIWIDELSGQIVDYYVPGDHVGQERSLRHCITSRQAGPRAPSSSGEQLAFDFVDRDSALHGLTGLQGAGPRLLQSPNSRPLLLLAGGGVP